MTALQQTLRENESVSEFFIKRDTCPGCDQRTHQTYVYSRSYSDPIMRKLLESSYDEMELEYLKDADFVLLRCGNCGLVYQHQVPNGFLMGKVYEEWIDPQLILRKRSETVTLENYAEYAAEIMTLIGYLKANPNQMRVLDFGMGWGAWCKMAKAFGCDSYGVELSVSRIEHARAQGIRILTEKEVADYQFDVINVDQVLEHVSNPLAILRHLAKSLNPVGLMKVSVPDGRDLKRRLKVEDWTAPKGSRNSLNVVSPLQHINCFNYSAMSRMVDAAGLRIVQVPLSVQYAYSTNWARFVPALKNILRPLYRHVLHRGLYLFLRRKQ